MASIAGRENIWLEDTSLEDTWLGSCLDDPYPVIILHVIPGLVNLPRLVPFQRPGHSRGAVDSLLSGQLTWLNVAFPLPAIAFAAYHAGY
jgi:hypothetical protein